MRHRERARQAMYWTAVSLIVCERLTLDEAARRLNLDEETLEDLLDRHAIVQSDLQPRDADERRA